MSWVTLVCSALTLFLRFDKPEKVASSLRWCCSLTALTSKMLASKDPVPIVCVLLLARTLSLISSCSARFTQTLTKVLNRHAPVVTTLAQGIMEL